MKLTQNLLKLPITNDFKTFGIYVRLGLHDLEVLEEIFYILLLKKYEFNCAYIGRNLCKILLKLIRRTY